MLYPTDLKAILAGEALERQQKPQPDQFRASLDRHLESLITEEEDAEVQAKSYDSSAAFWHAYTASILRELRAWLKAES